MRRIFVSRSKLRTILNMTGFALGLTACILVSVWIDSETNFDSFHRKGDNIYRILSHGTSYMVDGFPVSPGKLGVEALDRIPEIKDQARIFVAPTSVFRNGDKAVISNAGILADPAFFKIFSFPLVAGDPADWLAKPNSIILTRQLSEKIFNSVDVLGKGVVIDSDYYTITGILEDVPLKSHLKFEFVASVNLVDDVAAHWGSFAYNTYFEIVDNPDLDKIEKELLSIAIENRCPQVVQDSLVFRLQPLAQIYLDTPMKARWPYLRNGDRSSINLYILIGIIILLMVSVNYVNFSVAMGYERNMEVGIRKVAGGTRWNIFIQFVRESSLQVVISALLALIIAFNIYPLIENFTGKSLNPVLSFNLLAYIICAVIMAIVFSALYPSLVQAGKNIIDMKRADVGKGQIKARYIMLFFQAVVSGVLLFVSLFLIKQLFFIKNSELGFNPDDICCVRISKPARANNMVLRDRLLDNPAVKNVSFSNFLWVEINDRCGGCIRWDGKSPDYNPEMRKAAVSYDYFRTLGVNIIEGRSFSRNFPADDGSAFMINESAAKLIGTDDIIGLGLSESGINSMVQSGTVVGVFDDYKYSTLKSPVEPIVVRLLGDSLITREASVMYVSYVHEAKDLITSAVSDAWDNINPGIPLESFTLKEVYNKQYLPDKRTYLLIFAFTTVAVLIALMGLLGMITFLNEKKRKEICMRKIMGGYPADIIFMQLKTVLVLFALSLVISVPMSYIIINRVLSDYQFRVPVRWSVFLITSIILASLISLIIAGRTLKISRLNPSEVIRYQ